MQTSHAVHGSTIPKGIESINAVIAFDFGDGGIADGQLQPGPANEAIARYVTASIP